MSLRRGSWGGRLLALLAGTVLGCGGPDICLQCPTGTPTPAPSGAIVTGTIVSIVPTQTPANVTVVICIDLPVGGTADDCTQSFFTSVTTQGNFTRTNVKAGSETIFFWVDTDDDGTIDPEDGDLVAQLVDTEGQLDDIQSGQTVTLSNVSILFLDSTATADITVGLTPTPTPSPVQATPTPTAT